MPVCSVMVVLNIAAFLLSARADTLDRQHLIVSVLTSLNGLVILWLASTGFVLPGYGISALMLLFVFGFLARTGFIFAAWRSAIIVAGFVVAANVYPGRGNMRMDAFIFGAGWSAHSLPCGSSSSHAAASSTRTRSSPSRQTR